MNKGLDLGGVNSLKRLRCRCHIDSETGCWNWGFGTYKGLPRVAVALGEGKHRMMNGRRAAILLSGVELTSKVCVFASAKCQSLVCVNPAHTKYGTRKQAGEELALSGRSKANLGAKKGGKISGERRRRLSSEQAAEIRASAESMSALAERFGVNRSNIHAIKVGRTYKVEGASVFNWRP